MIGLRSVLGRLLKEAAAKLPWRLASGYPRLQTCCQLERMKDAWRGRL